EQAGAPPFRALARRGTLAPRAARSRRRRRRTRRRLPLCHRVPKRSPASPPPNGGACLENRARKLAQEASAMSGFPCLAMPIGLPYSSASSQWLGGERMHDRNAHIRLFLSTAATALALTSCHVPSVCDPPGNTAGTLVRARNSEAYLAEMNKLGGDVAHVGC